MGTDKQHQGEPVAYADPKSFENFKAMAHLGGLYLHEWMWAEPKAGLVPLYTHADPNVRWKAVADEQMQVIEGLQRRIQNAGLALKVQTHKCDTLRADVETMRRKNNEYWHETEYLRAQQAERDALLREVLEAFQLEPDGSCINPGRDFIRPWAAKVAALSASAEPSNPVGPKA